MYCSNCGKKLSEDDFFCSNCGTPVLRQNLFNDSNDDDAGNDAFEETRLFTAEELGQFLDDQPEEVASIVEEPYQSNQAYQYQQPVQEPVYREQPVYTEEPVYTEPPVVNSEMAVDTAQETPVKKGVDAKEMMSGAIGSANAFMGKFKARHEDKKAKKAEKKQAAAAEENVTVTEATIEEAPADGPTPLKKIILPVIVLGLVIGLVFGLIIVQPWNNDSEEAGDTAVSTIMVADTLQE